MLPSPDNLSHGRLTVDSTEFQDTAERLAQGTTEGDWRSAVSRAYYGVFHHFREFFLANGLDLGRGGQAHFNLYAGLQNCGIAAVAPLGNQVDDLRDSRVWADYDLNRALPQRFALQEVARAAQLVADFQTHLATILAQQIVDGVRHYLQSIGRLPTP
jgi:hypothetical protein